MLQNGKTFMKQNVIAIVDNTILFHRILSQVDGKSMEGTESEKIAHTRDFERKGKVVKCTEVSKLCCTWTFFTATTYST